MSFQFFVKRVSAQKFPLTATIFSPELLVLRVFFAVLKSVMVMIGLVLRTSRMVFTKLYALAISSWMCVVVVWLVKFRRLRFVRVRGDV